MDSGVHYRLKDICVFMANARLMQPQQKKSQLQR